MKFCSDCNNMLYSIVRDKAGAFFECRYCKKREEITYKTPIVYEHDLRQDTSIQYSINPYIKYDSTLPTFTNMICPNESCPTRGQASSIKGIKLDPVNVMWMYQCTECNQTWKQLARGPA